jgi:hypothetical protein
MIERFVNWFLDNLWLILGIPAGLGAALVLLSDCREVLHG